MKSDNGSAGKMTKSPSRDCTGDVLAMIAMERSRIDGYARTVLVPLTKCL